MKLSTGRMFTIVLLIAVIGAAYIAFQQTERGNQTQTALIAINATAQAGSTQAVSMVEAGNATLAAVEQNAADEIAAVRSAASTLQAGSIGTRTGLEARVEDLQTSATDAAQSAATAVADAGNANMTAVAFATEAAATQSAHATVAADLAGELNAAQATRDSLAEAATANAMQLSTQEIALAALSTQAAQAEAARTTEPTAAATARLVATATPSIAASEDDARIRRDGFLREFPLPFIAGGIEWSLADDPEFRLDEAGEASIGLLLVNEAGDRAILAVFFGSSAERYRALAEQAIPALGLTPLEDQPDGFPSPSVFGQSEQMLEALWVQGTVLARVTLANDVEDGEAKLVALARALLELLSDA